MVKISLDPVQIGDFLHFLDVSAIFLLLFWVCLYGTTISVAFLILCEHYRGVSCCDTVRLAEGNVIGTLNQGYYNRQEDFRPRVPTSKVRDSVQYFTACKLQGSCNHQAKAERRTNVSICARMLGIKKPIHSRNAVKARHESRITNHESRIMNHESRITLRNLEKS